MTERTNVEQYLNRLKKGLNTEYTIRKLHDSLYQAGPEKVLIHATKPDSDTYFFGFQPAFMEEANQVILICGNDLCAFKLPVTLLKQLPFNTDPKTDRNLTTVGYDGEQHYWWMSLKKDNEGSRLDISRFFVNLKSEEEVMAEALALRELLGLSD